MFYDPAPGQNGRPLLWALLAPTGSFTWTHLPVNFVLHPKHLERYLPDSPVGRKHFEGRVSDLVNFAWPGRGSYELLIPVVFLQRAEVKCEYLSNVCLELYFAT